MKISLAASNPFAQTDRASVPYRPVQAAPVFGQISFRSDQMDIPAMELPPHPSRTMIAVGRHLAWLNLRYSQGIRKIEVQNGEQIRQLLKEGKHLILAPNHPGFGDVYLTPKLSQVAGRPSAAIGQIGLFYAIKSPYALKATLQPAMNWALSRIGIFPVHGDIKDTGALKTAIDVVDKGKNPFIIFPEGHYTWQNDRISELQYGAASIGLKAAARLNEKHLKEEKQPLKEVAIVPIGIKHRFLQNVLPNLEKTLAKMEEQVGLAPAEKPAANLQQLVPRVETLWLKVLNDTAVVHLKDELPSLPVKSQSLAQRHHEVTETLISSVEKALNIAPQPDESYAQRIKNTRKFHRLMRNMPGVLSQEEKRQFDEVYKPRLVKAWEFQKFSTDYLRDKVTPERIAETLFKLDYILTSEESDMMAELGSRKTIIKVGEPIILTPELSAFQQNQRETVARVTTTLRSAMQSLIDSVQ